MNTSIADFKPATQVKAESDQDCKFVEVLTSDLSGELMGYCIGGSRPGPNAVLAGNAPLMSALFNRFMDLPTLPWMWGRLYLVTLESADTELRHGVCACLPDIAFDGLIMLPYEPHQGGHARSVESGYWTGLRLCSQLGMIEGRGVRM